MTDNNTESMTDAEKQEFLAECDELGILKVRNELEEGEYGESDSPRYLLAEGWLEKQHLKQLDSLVELKNEPKRLAAVILLVCIFFGLFFYIFAY